MAWRDDTPDDRDEAELDERELPSGADVGDDDDLSVDTESCPFCGKPVYERADVCPHCHNYIAFDAVPPRRPVWFWVGLGACGLVVALWALWPGA